MHPDLPAYAELHCLSNFTFLRGASHPEELVERAAALGYSALALTDECSFAGVVRAHVAAKRCGLKLIVGSEVELEEGVRLVLIATDRRSYGAIASVITTGRRRARKGSYALARGDLDALAGSGALVLLIPGPEVDDEAARWIAARFPDSAWIAAELHSEGRDRERLATLRGLAAVSGLALVAAGGVHMHLRSRRRLQDTLTAIRIGKPVAECGHALHPNAERHLRPRMRLAQIYPAALLAETLRNRGTLPLFARRAALRISGRADSRGRDACELAAAADRAGHAPALSRRRSGRGCRELIEHELALIAELALRAVFSHGARHRQVRAQPRHPVPGTRLGGELGGVLCLGITEVDPARMSMLFERFISKERNEPPDIDVDFEHERREEVIQYIYAQVRPRARGARRDRHQLPAAQRDPRRRQGARAGPSRSSACRAVDAAGGTSAAGSRRTHARGRLRSGQPAIRPLAGAGPTRWSAFPATCRSTSAAS